MKELVLLPSILAISTAFQMFAQNTGDKVDANIGALVGNLGIMGVLVWHLWWTTTRTYPEMLAKFQSETSAMREAFDREQAELRGVFDREQRTMRDAFLAEQKAQRDHNSQVQSELRTVLIQHMQAMRTAVHDVKDTAQVTLNKIQAVQAGSDLRATQKPGGPG